MKKYKPFSVMQPKKYFEYTQNMSYNVGVEVDVRGVYDCKKE